LNRYAASFSDVSGAEMAELAVLVGQLERALKCVFDYDVINYLMLMMVDKQVHFHVIPRYPAGRRFAGLEWLDSGWPAMPALADQQKHRERADVLVLIRDRFAGGLCRLMAWPAVEAGGGDVLAGVALRRCAPGSLLVARPSFRCASRAAFPCAVSAACCRRPVC
jgi:diadenosine tetraphosphate (Ap4A) HIT family hydrolase